MKIKILYIERKFWEFVSIEKVFRQIAENLSKIKFEYSFVQMPFGNGFEDVIRNLMFFRKKKADIYHITGHIHYIGLVLPKNRTVLTIHDLGFLHTRKGLRRFVLKKLYLDFPIRKLKYITAISEATKNEILKYSKCSKDKIRVIENPIKEFAGNKKRKFNENCPTILQIGTSPNKNLFNLIKALNGVSCVLKVIGKLEPQQLEALHHYGISYKNSFNLSDTEIEEEYRKADIVAFCSTYEGFGLPIIEAQCVGVPVITSNISPMSEVSGHAACLVDPEDSSDIRHGILKLINNTNYRNELIEKGLKNIERFGASDIAARYERLYSEILSESKNVRKN